MAAISIPIQTLTAWERSANRSFSTAARLSGTANPRPGSLIKMAGMGDGTNTLKRRQAFPKFGCPVKNNFIKGLA
jgi:hypothetical protein